MRAANLAFLLFAGAAALPHAIDSDYVRKDLTKKLAKSDLFKRPIPVDERNATAQYIIDKTTHGLMEKHIEPSLLELSEEGERGFHQAPFFRRAIKLSLETDMARALKSHGGVSSLPVELRAHGLHAFKRSVLKSFNMMERKGRNTLKYVSYWQHLLNAVKKVWAIIEQSASIAFERLGVEFGKAWEAVVQGWAAFEETFPAIANIIEGVVEEVKAVFAAIMDLVSTLVNEFINTLITALCPAAAASNGGDMSDALGLGDGTGFNAALNSETVMTSFQDIRALVPGKEEACAEATQVGCGSYENGAVAIVGGACNTIWAIVDQDYPAISRFRDILTGDSAAARRSCPLAAAFAAAGDGDAGLMLSTSVGFGGSVTAKGVQLGGEMTLEAGIGISANGQRFCFVGGCGTISAGLDTAGYGAEVSISGAVTLAFIRDVGDIQGEGVGIGASASVDGAGVGFDIGITFMLPGLKPEDAPGALAPLKWVGDIFMDPLNSLQGFAFTIGMSQGIPVGVAALGGADFVVEVGYCYTPVCITADGNACGMERADRSKCGLPTTENHCACVPCGMQPDYKYHIEDMYRGRFDDLDRYAGEDLCTCPLHTPYCGTGDDDYDLLHAGWCYQDRFDRTHADFSSTWQHGSACGAEIGTGCRQSHESVVKETTLIAVGQFLNPVKEFQLTNLFHKTAEQRVAEKCGQHTFRTEQGHSGQNAQDDCKVYNMDNYIAGADGTCLADESGNTCYKDGEVELSDVTFEHAHECVREAEAELHGTVGMPAIQAVYVHFCKGLKVKDENDELVELDYLGCCFFSEYGAEENGLALQKVSLDDDECEPCLGTTDAGCERCVLGGASTADTANRQEVTKHGQWFRIMHWKIDIEGTEVPNCPSLDIVKTTVPLCGTGDPGFVQAQVDEVNDVQDSYDCREEQVGREGCDLLKSYMHAVLLQEGCYAVHPYNNGYGLEPADVDVGDDFQCKCGEPDDPSKKGTGFVIEGELPNLPCEAKWKRPTGGLFGTVEKCRSECLPTDSDCLETAKKCNAGYYNMGNAYAAVDTTEWDEYHEDFKQNRLQDVPSLVSMERAQKMPGKAAKKSAKPAPRLHKPAKAAKKLANHAPRLHKPANAPKPTWIVEDMPGKEAKKSTNALKHKTRMKSTGRARSLEPTEPTVAGEFELRRRIAALAQRAKGPHKTSRLHRHGEARRLEAKLSNLEKELETSSTLRTTSAALKASA